MAVPVPAHVGTPIDGGGSLLVRRVTVDTTNMLVVQPFDVPLPDGARFMTVPQDDGSEVAVLALESIDIVGDLTVRGSRPLILVADRITIEQGGRIDASAHGAVPGPGGQLVAPGRGYDGAGDDGSGIYAGGGGGSFGGPGGRGSVDVRGGFPYGGPSLTRLFAGSCGGYGGAIVRSCAALGGGGGGALQLTGGIVEIDGEILANGGGGAGGHWCGSAATGGGGGGSGGAIYIQATRTLGNGWLSANGGGGGSSGDELGAAGEDGQDGQDQNWVASGGATGGGDGATAKAAAQDAWRGGGGGGVGRIFVSSAEPDDTMHGSPTITR